MLGTFVTITAHGQDRALLNRAATAAFDEIRRVDALMSIHRTDSELSRVNRMAASEPIRVSAELFEVLTTAHHIATATEGGFDVTTRPLIELWGFVWKDYRFPTDQELQAALPLVGFTLIQLDATRQTVFFKRPGVSIDLGGIAKGYAVDAALRRLQSLGVTNAMVKAGGDLRVSGSPPNESGWTVQLEDPRKQGRRVAIRLHDAALSTSGDYENFFVHNGKRYSHIIDPRTGMPIDDAASCTVIAQTCMESDAWATACMIYGVDASIETFGNQFAIRFILAPENNPEGALEVHATEGFPRPPIAPDKS